MNIKTWKIAFVVVGAALGSALLAANAGHNSAVTEGAVNRPTVVAAYATTATNPIFTSDAYVSTYGVDLTRTTDW